MTPCIKTRQLEQNGIITSKFNEHKKYNTGKFNSFKE